MKKNSREIILSKEQGIAEAKRHLQNARQTLRKVPVKYGLYTDPKYVREASGIAYIAALKAIDSYLFGKGWRNEELPDSIEEYWKAKRSIPHNGKFTAYLSTAYQSLHRGGYYNGLTVGALIKEGIHSVEQIIKMLEN